MSGSGSNNGNGFVSGSGGGGGVTALTGVVYTFPTTSTVVYNTSSSPEFINRKKRTLKWKIVDQATFDEHLAKYNKLTYHTVTLMDPPMIFCWNEDVPKPSGVHALDMAIAKKTAKTAGRPELFYVRV